MSQHSHARIAIVGAGPRGLSVLERICAQERKSPAHEQLTVHVIDPSPPGAGAVWRTAQPRHLLMNTVSSQITLYTDDSVTIEGPIEEGPSLYAWSRRLTADPEGSERRYGAQTVAEARELGPDSYPTRAFYGHYLQWAFEECLAGAPEHVTVQVHRTRAVALTDADTPDGAQTLDLADGVRLTGLSAVVLAQGHLPAKLGAEEQRLSDFAAAHGLSYTGPSNPADVDLSAIGPGRPVLLRGLGLNFFDYMALFTLGRGGFFERRADGRLVYRPSGLEPKMYAGSRRGIPYQARGENEKGAHGRYHPRLLTVERVQAMRAAAKDGDWIDFGIHIWPLIQKEVQSVYYERLLAARGGHWTPDLIEDFTSRYLAAADDEAEEALLAEAGIDGEERWNWKTLSRPYGDLRFTGRDDFRRWMLAYLLRDAKEAREGNVSGPLKAALDVLRDLRNEIRLAVDHGGLHADSHRDDLDGWYTPLNAFLSIGPPVSRIDELIALASAGIVEFTGPGLRVRTESEGPDGPVFVATADGVDGEDIRLTALIEARLPHPDLRRTTDALLVQLLETGQCRPYKIRGSAGIEYETGGLAVSERPYRLIDADGNAHPRRFAYGVPTEAVHWVTAAGIRPGVGSVTLEDSDAVAHAALALPAVEAPLATAPAGEVRA
ncbi:FAD/NAD(P)-binding domain-containing protein [Streptomyces sp. WAC06614]|uniref:FAD/NAD(P)-binding protein n=1 Tax=Streptomyces sp. WAC06614 TaxID=2487416 RepID=UPI000F7785BE|nr:FAD/NAD(P)-binding protein [Streptomyces sp. WAC06614]RSS80762.1 FAD-binding protein [Streptomyces sp. WAC06614]